MKHLSFFLLLTLAVSQTLCQEVVELQTKTGPQNDADMDAFGNVNIELVNLNFETCIIFELNGDGNDFEENAVDVFVGEDLQDCFQFPAPNHEIPLLIITHKGGDAWVCEWIKIVFDDGVYIDCPDGAYIDDEQEHTLECSLPGNGTIVHMKVQAVQQKLNNLN